MKRIHITILFFLIGFISFGQTDGISYQAVIIGPDEQELPGVDAQGNIIPNTEIDLRFTIFDASSNIEFQEVQTTTTDAFGRINLVIGSTDTPNFTKISWDGTTKNLLVEIDFDGGSNDFIEMSDQELLFLPYAFHRNITATGTLKVDDDTELYSNLTVDGITNLNNILNVNENSLTNLSGDLNVDGNTNLNSDLDVEGATHIGDSLLVDGAMELNNDFSVNGTTRLNDSLFVEGPANLNNRLVVDGAATLNDSLSVTGVTNLEKLFANGVVTFNNSFIADGQQTSYFLGDFTTGDSATATFLGPTNFTGPSAFSSIDVSGTSSFGGRMILTANPGNGDESEMNNYPLLVQGSKQGIAIKVNGGRSIDNNFVSFWDEDTGEMWGRIEGLTFLEQASDLQHLGEHAGKIYNVIISVAEVGIYAAELVYGGVELGLTLGDIRLCAGIGACAVAPSPQMITARTVEIILKIANGIIKGVNLEKAIAEEVAFVARSINSIGVSYQSGAGDYAEWLPKQKNTEVFVPGELVGIKDGRVSKNTFGSEKVMIVSTNPIVLGNMPQPDQEENSVMIAFIGQVPVKVLGKVEAGDYIVPNLFVEGFATAIHPRDMKTSDYKNIAGVAWNVIETLGEGLSIVNVAVGLNTNDLSDVLVQQEEEIQELKDETVQLEQQLARSIGILSDLVPGYAEAMGTDVHADHVNHVHSEPEYKDDDERPQPGDIASIDENDIVYFEISDDQIEASIEMARELYVNMLEDKADISSLLAGKDEDMQKAMNDMVLMPIEEHPFWQRIDNEPAYKAEVINFIQASLEKSFHTHKKYIDRFTDFKVKE